MGADGGIYLITADQAATCPHWGAWMDLPAAYKQTDPFGNTIYTFYSDNMHEGGFDDPCWPEADAEALIEWIQNNGIYWEVWT